MAYWVAGTGQKQQRRVPAFRETSESERLASLKTEMEESRSEQQAAAAAAGAPRDDPGAPATRAAQAVLRSPRYVVWPTPPAAPTDSLGLAPAEELFGRRPAVRVGTTLIDPLRLARSRFAACLRSCPVWLYRRLSK